jgi:hypothetical protein
MDCDPVNDFDDRHGVSDLPMGTSTVRMARLRKRRRRGESFIAAIEVDLPERRKLMSLGYLETATADKGALDAAAGRYFSDKLFEEK